MNEFYEHVGNLKAAEAKSKGFRWLPSDGVLRSSVWTTLLWVKLSEKCLIGSESPLSKRQMIWLR